MPTYEPQETYYYSDMLKIKQAYFEYKGKIYATQGICTLEKDEVPAKRPWHFLILMGGAAATFFAIRSLFVLRGMDGTFYVMIFWLMLAVILFFWAYRYNLTNIPNYSLTITTMKDDPITISFDDDEFDRNDAFDSLLRAMEGANMILSDEEAEADEEEWNSFPHEG